MKKFLVTRILPLLISTSLILLVNNTFQEKLFRVSEQSHVKNEELSNYIDDFSSNSSVYQDVFLTNDTNKVYVLGSSELTSESKYVPQKYLNETCKLPVVAIGEAGNQNFSIYCQLLAKNQSLENSKLVIFLSPSWFFGSAAKGTHTEVFIKNITDKFIHQISLAETNKENQFLFDYAKKEMQEHLKDVSNLSLETEGLLNEYQLDKNFFHQIGSQLLKPFYSSSMFVKKQIFTENKITIPITKNGSTFSPNWESLKNRSIEEFKLISTNNSFGIDSMYYNTYINGETTTLDIVAKKNNREFKDFEMLLKLLKHYKVDASFVIMPINPHYYVDLNRLSPLINEMESKIKKNNFHLLNLWEPSTEKYIKGTLTDVMHFGDYGWLKVDEFIYNTYSKK